MQNQTTVEKLDDARWRINGPNGFNVVLSNFGATIIQLNVPDRNGNIEDVVLGFDTDADYNRDRDANPCFGSTIGRFANRIGKG